MRQLETIPIDAPKPSQKFRYIVVGTENRATGEARPVHFEVNHPVLEPGEEVGTGTVSPTRPSMEFRFDYRTGETREMVVCWFKPASERYSFLDIGRISAKLRTGEFAAVPIDDDE